MYCALCNLFSLCHCKQLFFSLSLRDMLKTCRGNHIHLYPHLRIFLFPFHFFPHELNILYSCINSEWQSHTLLPALFLYLFLCILPKTMNYEPKTLMAITYTIAHIRNIPYNIYPFKIYLNHPHRN